MYKKLKNLQVVPTDAPTAESFEVFWPRLPAQGEIYIAQDDDGNLYVSEGARGWVRARQLKQNG